jgi:hypothetical protein
MEKAISDYIKRSAQLEEILSLLTKEYCATKCHLGSLGCCHEDTYSIGIPEEMLKLQEAEAIQNGWKAREKGCKYHTNKGCAISLFKSPVCITSLCGGLNEHLLNQYGLEGKAFTDIMKKAKMLDLDKNSNESNILLSNLDEAIARGRKLVEMKC